MAAYIILLSDDILQVDEALFELHHLVVETFGDLSVGVELGTEVVAVDSAGRNSLVCILELAEDVFLDAEELLKRSNVVLELGVVLLEVDVVVLEVVEVVFQRADAALGTVEVILVSSLHGLDVTGTLDDVLLEVTDLGLEVLVGGTHLVEVGEDVVSLLLHTLEELAGGFRNLESLAEVIEFSLKVSVVVALLLNHVGEVVGLLLQLAVLAQELGTLLLDGRKGGVKSTDLVSETLEGVGVTLLSSNVVVAGLAELGLVDVGASQLDSELVVLVLELGVLDLNGVEAGLEIVHGVVGALEVAEDLGVVALELEDNLVELEGFFLELLGGLHERFSELFTGVVAVVDLAAEVVDLTLPGLLFAELEVEVVDDALEVLELVLVFVDVTASFSVHQETGHVGAGLGVGALGPATVTVSETLRRGGLVGTGASDSARRAHQSRVHEVGVGHVVELVQVDAVTDGGEIGGNAIPGLVEVSVDNLVHVVVQLGLRVTVTLGRALSLAGAATGVDGASSAAGTADGFLGGA